MSIFITMPKCAPLLTILSLKIAHYSSNIKIFGYQYQRTLEPLIPKVYELIRLVRKIVIVVNKVGK